MIFYYNWANPRALIVSETDKYDMARESSRAHWSVKPTACGSRFHLSCEHFMTSYKSVDHEKLWSISQIEIY